MDDDEDAPKEFPDVGQKLAAPKKLSAFEKERLAAEEKRRREQAETAAALAEFEDSFGGNDDFPSAARGPPSGPSSSSSRGYGGGHHDGGSRGCFGAPPRSGPGSLGPAAGPPPSMKRKRALDELREREALAAEFNLGQSSRPEERQRQTEEEEDEQEEEEPEIAAPRPTVQLSNLEPGTEDVEVRMLLKDHLKVHSVSISPPIRHGRLSVTAIATLDYETSTAQIDAAVSALRDKYLGCGYRLSISRHLSSTALQPGALPGMGPEPEPFGAERIHRDQHRSHSMRNAPPPSNFAPPDSYDARAPRNGGNEAYAFVNVEVPSDIRTVRAIHVLVERMLAEPDPVKATRIEACLMGQHSIQADERFAFLYDSESSEGLYYRYLLWADGNPLDLLQEKKRTGKASVRLFDDVAIDWNVTQGEMPFADLSNLGHIMDHPSWDSDYEDSDDEAEKRQFNSGRREGEGAASRKKKHLNPRTLYQFAWKLSHMPTTQAKLNVGDVCFTSEFAISQAGVGAEEIVDMLILNVEKPFCLTTCATDWGALNRAEQEDEDDYEPDEELPSIETPALHADRKIQSKNHLFCRNDDIDLSQVKLVSLYLINDVLLNSATAGVRNAWKYRQLIETALKRQNIFKKLGRLGKDLGWGRMKEQQWRNKIGALFEIWERNSCFSTDAFEAIKKDFFESPVDEKTDNNGEADRQAPKLLAKFKRIDGSASASMSPAPIIPSAGEKELDGAPLDDLDGAPIDDLDGTPMNDLDGVPMEDDTPPAQQQQQQQQRSPLEPEKSNGNAPAPVELAKTNGGGFSLKSSVNGKPMPAEPPRKKQAEDMFADSDED